MLSQPILIPHDRHADQRGWFAELGDTLTNASWIQENISFSKKGVLRGLHFQHPASQAKLVTVLVGEIFDVAVDLRRGSPNFGVAHRFSLDAEGDSRRLFLPGGFAHGFYVRSEGALVHYRTSEKWQPFSEHVLRWDDPALAIGWPLEGPPILSAKDSDGRPLNSFAEAELPLFKP